MKKMSLLLAGVLMLLPVVFGSGAANLFAQTTLSGVKKDAKILVAYFSRADENYGVGVIEKATRRFLPNSLRKN